MATATATLHFINYPSPMSTQTAAQNTDEASDRGDRSEASDSGLGARGKVFGGKAPVPLPSVAIYRPRSNSKAEYSAAAERAMEPPQDANLTASVVGPLPNFPQQQRPNFANPNQSPPQEKQKRKTFKFLRKKSISTPNSSLRNGSHDFMNTSAPSVLIRLSANSDELSPSLRSSMSCRTLEDSLHRGRSPSQCSSPGSGQRISFANVNIREYERVLGDNVSDKLINLACP